jgi:hypothetical protein
MEVPKIIVTANEVTNFSLLDPQKRFGFVQQCSVYYARSNTKIINSNSRHSMETSAVSYKTKKGYILFEKDEKKA